LLACLLFTTAAPLAAQSYFYLIGGSFSDLASAQKAISAMQNNGLNPVLLPPSGAESNYRISLFQSGDRQQVALYQKDLKKRGKPAGWILEMAPNRPQASTTTSSGGTTRSASAAATELPLPSRGTNIRTGESRYHLIIDSFKDSKQANGALTKYAADGFQPYIVIPPDDPSQYRISVYEATNRREIDTYAKMLDRKGMKGWIYTEEPGTVSGQTNTRLSGPQSKVEGTFYVIGASFKTFPEADAYATQARAGGLEPFILYPEQTDSDFFRVSVFQTNDEAQAKRFKESMRKQGTEAWTFVAK
jgi:cell division septation protein DedD